MVFFFSLKLFYTANRKLVVTECLFWFNILINLLKVKLRIYLEFRSMSDPWELSANDFFFSRKLLPVIANVSLYCLFFPLKYHSSSSTEKFAALLNTIVLCTYDFFSLQNYIADYIVHIKAWMPFSYCQHLWAEIIFSSNC